jgi:glyoxylate reductase
MVFRSPRIRQTAPVAAIFITRAIPGDAAETLRTAGHDVTIWPGETPPPRDELGRQLAQSDAAMTMVTDAVDSEMLAASPRLRVLSNMAVGYDNVDPAMAASHGVWLTNTPGVLADTTADLAFALLMAAARLVPQGERDVREERWLAWAPTGYLGVDVHRATLGVIGLGEIGEAMARRGRGFDMRVLYASRTRKPAVEAALGVEHATLEDLLRESDFVSIHTPLTAETRGLLDAERLALMKSTAVLVNTARGPIIDQDALVDALRAGTIGGAALDVTAPEPLPKGHPLLSLPNCIVTPHIGSASLATRSKMARMAAANILAVLDGRTPPNPVNRPESPRGAIQT